ncbi:hypothetical protein AVEN_235403-1 [Araneus ventricosus]|uniref:Uncharacterized protein n=1 Tax=Araneus ventricosus TaxID=182803 RepID=A0A4Y2A4J7_ARAVE|nr:hypothetical protein AVEN_235403-1 [Araneus ventricosus]
MAPGSVLSQCNLPIAGVESADEDIFLILDADLAKNVDATGESSVCNLVHRDKVRCPSATELWEKVWKGTTVPTNYSGLVYVIYGNR